MQTSVEGRKFIESQEGLVLHPYKDAVGVWTIGYGHTPSSEDAPAITQE